jgi:hypothetical protein
VVVLPPLPPSPPFPAKALNGAEKISIVATTIAFLVSMSFSLIIVCVKNALSSNSVFICHVFMSHHLDSGQ